jgi:hypothetical protein
MPDWINYAAGASSRFDLARIPSALPGHSIRNEAHMTWLMGVGELRSAPALTRAAFLDQFEHVLCATSLSCQVQEVRLNQLLCHRPQAEHSQSYRIQPPPRESPL